MSNLLLDPKTMMNLGFRGSKTGFVDYKRRAHMNFKTFKVRKIEFLASTRYVC